MPPVVVVGTLDTKGDEIAFVREVLRGQGVATVVVDAGTAGPPRCAADVPREVIFRLAGAPGGPGGDRGEAVATAARGVERWVTDAAGRGEVAGVLAIGGSAGTVIGTSAMRALPFGVPKVMVSTLASGQTRPFVGGSDILMLYPVADLAGLNRLTTVALTNAALAMAGMVRPRVETNPISGTGTSRGTNPIPAADTADGTNPISETGMARGTNPISGTTAADETNPIPGGDTARGTKPISPEDDRVETNPIGGAEARGGTNPIPGRDPRNGTNPIPGRDARVETNPIWDGDGRPLVAATMFGVTTSCVDRARRRLEGAGTEVVVFHATGVGGLSMEGLARDGRLAGVLDLTTTELADELVGGLLSAGPRRLEAAVGAGLPQVVSVGALDMVNFGPRATVPDRFAGRLFHEHNPTVTLMRTTPAENAELAAWIARVLATASTPTVVLLPLRGVSALDAPGGPFHSPEADRALFDGLTRRLAGHPHVRVEARDEHINDPAFADSAADRLLDLMGRNP